MLKPPSLNKGDKIGIVAPARKITEKEIQPALNIIENWGFKVVPGNHLFEQFHQFAGNDKHRLLDMQTMLDDPDIKAILCARGGYGTLRIIDHLDFTSFKQKPKWIIGYSDITVLHAHIHANFGIETMHATMPLNFPVNGKENVSLQTLRKALQGEKLNYSIKAHSLSRYGQTSGLLTGGNLSMLYSLNATASDVDTKNKILFIEDVDEYLYHIDRMMLNLKRSGKLAHLAGMIVGGMTGMKDNDIPFGKNAYEIIKENISLFKFPVLFGFPAGHENENRVLILGREIKLTVDKISEVEFS